MNVRTANKKSGLTDAAKQTAIIGGLFFGACLLGAAIISLGGNSSSQTVAFGILASLAIGGMLCLVLELPVITVVRFAFIASFFFKGEMNLYKLDEIEDPSGFNLSLTLLTGVILLIYDQFDDTQAKEKVFPSAFSLLIIALLFSAVASVLYSGSNLLGWFSVWSFTTSILTAYVIASHFSRRERLIQLIIGIAGGLLFTGIISSAQYFLELPTNLAFFGTGTEDEMIGTQSVALSRVPGFLRTPTEMAWVISTFIPLVVAPLICRVKDFSSRRKVFLLTAALSGIVAVILSLARGSWISLVAAIAVLVLFGWFRLSKIERKSYIASVGGVLIFACLLLSPFAARIYERLSADDDGSALVRVPLMETAVRIIEDNPLVGVGLNEYRTAMTKYDETAIFVSQVFPNPVHNVFAHVTAEVGIPGGIIFCLLLIFGLFECFKTMTSHDRLLFAVGLGAAAAIIAFVISGMKEPGSLGSGRPPLRTCFFLLGTILAVSRIREQNSRFKVQGSRFKVQS